MRVLGRGRGGNWEAECNMKCTNIAPVVHRSANYSFHCRHILGLMLLGVELWGFGCCYLGWDCGFELCCVCLGLVLGFGVWGLVLGFVGFGSWGWELGLGGWGLELGLGVGCWELGFGSWGWELGLGVGVGSWGWELGLGVGVWELGLGVDFFGVMLKVSGRGLFELVGGLRPPPPRTFRLNPARVLSLTWLRSGDRAWR